MKIECVMMVVIGCSLNAPRYSAQEPKARANRDAHGEVRCMASKTLLLGIMDGMVRLWDVATVLDNKKPESVAEKPKVVKDRVKGSIHHSKGTKIWERITGKARVIDASTVEFDDGTRVALSVVAPALEQKGLIDGSLYPCGKEAAEFLRRLIADRPVTCLLVANDKWVGYVGDTNLTHAMVLNGWAVADHSTLHAAEIIARENRRGLWRGQFIDPDDWRAGKRLPGEK